MLKSLSKLKQPDLMIDLACLFLLFLANLLIFIYNVQHVGDDSEVTYRYAYNFAHGLGFVYNPHEYYLGTSAPFYGLMLGVIGLLNSNIEFIPSVGGWICGFSLLMGGVAIYIYGRLFQQRLVGLIAGLLYITNIIVVSAYSSEMMTVTALVAWGFVFYRLGWTKRAAFILAIAVLTRPDAILALVVVAVHFVWTKRPAEWRKWRNWLPALPWREVLVVLVVITPFALACYKYFGVILPDTLSAKLAQSNGGGWTLFRDGSWNLLTSTLVQQSNSATVAMPDAFRYIAFFAIGVPSLWFFRWWVLPLAWSLLNWLAYGYILNAPFYPWYMLATLFGLAIITACGVGALVTGLTWLVRCVRQKQTWQTVALTVSVLVTLALTPGFVAQIQQVQDQGKTWPNALNQLYARTGKWLALNTPPDAKVGYFEIGYIGYYSQRTIIDPLGLVNPAFPPNVISGDIAKAYRDTRPDYILFHNTRNIASLANILNEDWFKQAYQPIYEISQQDYGYITVYQRHTATPAAQK